MSASMWAIVLTVAILQASIIAGVGVNIWGEIGADEQASLLEFWTTYEGLGVSVLAVVQLLPALALTLVYRRYILPLKSIAEEVQMIALSNPRHRLAGRGPEELMIISDSINLLADCYQRLQEDLEARVREAAAALEDERDTLATLMSKLTQGVVVCNLEGRILLYNAQAQALLEGPTRGTGGGDWIGLGRSIYSILEEGPISHALMTLVHARQRGEMLVLAPFMVGRPGGQLLNVHLVPISGANRRWHGYILTLEDVTRRMEREARRAKALQTLIERQRAAVTGIRAGIEAILNYPDMEEAERQRFHRLIHEEALNLSGRFQGLEDELTRDIRDQSPLQDALASDLLAAIERHLQAVLGIPVEVIVPLEPIRLRADTYGLARCLIFLIRQLQQACGATEVSLAIEAGRSLVTLVINWQGRPVHEEALRLWGARNVFADLGGTPVSLFEMIERHSGAIWPQPPNRDRRPGLRLLLPLGHETTEEGKAAVEDHSFRQEFDFRLSARPAHAADPATARLTDLIYTVIDTETTGLNPDRGDEIISVAAVRIVNGRVLRREIFDSLVNPRRSVPAESQAIHGISPGMLRAAPGIEDVLPRLARFVEDTVIVGHNIAFDLKFFRHKEAAAGVRFRNPVLDTLLLERLVHPNQENRRLEAIAARLGITVTGRHTALGDALTTAEVFLALVPVLAQHGIVTLGQALDLCTDDLEARVSA